MNRIVVAFESEKSINFITEMLESSGITVRYRCRSGGEVIRSINYMGGGIVICGYKLHDMPASNLAFDLENSASVLVLAKPAQIELCDNEIFFSLPTPVNRSMLCGSVRMLAQLEEKHLQKTLPRRNKDKEELLKKAKALLMEKENISEKEAHRLIQRKSMDTCTEMAVVAQYFIAMMEKYDE
ncbi:MAG: ANTAR domain-containing protein [Bacteroidales bacterium]|nr:ANTAR domain-containing protein [Bacteroidales bacterium]